jgi:hypothetical protein
MLTLQGPDNLTLAKKDFTDYEFIIEEAKRFIGLSIPEIRKHYGEHPEDALITLRGSEGNELLFTRKGESHFHNIVRRGLKALGTDSKIHDFFEVVKALKCEFMNRLDRGPINDENAHTLFESALKHLGSQYMPMTHFVPCCIVLHRHPERFRIGPVEFLRRELFMKQNELALRGDSPPKVGFGFEEMEKFFSHFQWVASVDVAACDKRISQRRARNVIQMGLDLFKLFIGSGRASLIRQAYDLASPAETAHLVRPLGENFSISINRKMQEAVVVEDWYDIVSRSRPWGIAESLISDSFASITDPSEPHQRFFDALAWHGEAVSEQPVQSKVLKFWIGIERVVSLRHNDKITRKAALLTSRESKDFPDRLWECDRLYGKRSALMHGSIKRDSESFQRIGFEVEKLSAAVLFSYLYLLESLKRKGPATIEILEAEFQRLDSVLSPR